jgi:septal ring factor EnvC (AmiA/AmiB activator)
VSKVIPVVLLILLATIILCVGCAPAVAREDFDKVKGDLATTRTELGSTKNQLTTAQDQVKILQAQVAKLSAMSAYTI